MDFPITLLQTWGHMGDGWGWWMLFGWLWMALFWGAIIWIVVALTRRNTAPASSQPRNGSALAILEERYARGELSAAEFEERRSRLLGR